MDAFDLRAVLNCSAAWGLLRCLVVIGPRPVPAPVHGPQEAADRAVADPAAVLDARLDRLAEVEPDEDAREPVLLRGLGEAAVA